MVKPTKKESQSNVHIENLSIDNKAASVSPELVPAFIAIANASAAHADALKEMAAAIKGASPTMHNGASFSHIGDKE